MKKLSFGLIVAGMLAGSANAADIPTKAAVSTAAAPITYRWDNIFFGLNLGYGQTTGDTNVDSFTKDCIKSGHSRCYGPRHYSALSASSIPGVIPGDADGLSVGGQLGIRKQFGQFTIGGIVDWEWDTIKGNQSAAFGNGFTNVKTKITNIGTAVAELGWAPGSGSTLFAVDGGFAWGTVKHSLISTALVSMPDDSSTKTGWTLGGKIETQLRDGWTTWIGYRYVDLGKYSNTVSYTDGVNNYSNVMSGNNHVNEIRVGFHKAINVSP